MCAFRHPCVVVSKWTCLSHSSQQSASRGIAAPSRASLRSTRATALLTVPVVEGKDK